KLPVSPSSRVVLVSTREVATVNRAHCGLGAVSGCAPAGRPVLRVQIDVQFARFDDPDAGGVNRDAVPSKFRLAARLCIKGDVVMNIEGLLIVYGRPAHQTTRAILLTRLEGGQHR